MGDKYVVVYVLGGPGAGKGTQCAKIVEKYGWEHFSAGDLLRAEVASGSEQGASLQATMNEGGIVPFEVTIGLIHAAMKKSGKGKFLIDGFPRALDQAAAFESTVCESTAMLFLDCPEDVMQERLMGRAEGRSDDNPETIRKRFRVYQETTMPVIEEYKTQGKLRHVIADRTPDEVFADVAAIIDAIEAPSAAPAEATGDLLGLDNLVTPAAAPATEPAVAAIVGVAPVVVIGPSGVGKGTLVRRLMAEHGDKFAFTVSHTTRPPREGEVDGQAYHFTDRDTMQQGIDGGDFLEHAEVHGNLYGTSVAAVERCSAAGTTPVLEIDVQGARLVKAAPVGSKALFVFVKPPSLEALEARLRGRDTEDDATVRTRLDNAAAELAAADDSSLVNVVIVNGDVDAAYAELCTALTAHMGTDVLPAASAAATEPAPAPASQLPAKEYLDATVVPALRRALEAVNAARPEQPLQRLIEELQLLQGGGSEAQPSLV